MTSTYDRWKTECYEDTLDDPIEEAECSVCGKQLDDYALELLNEESEPDESNAMCTPCRKIDDGDTDE